MQEELRKDFSGDLPPRPAGDARMGEETAGQASPLMAEHQVRRCGRLQFPPPSWFVHLFCAWTRRGSSGSLHPAGCSGSDGDPCPGPCPWIRVSPAVMGFSSLGRCGGQTPIWLQEHGGKSSGQAVFVAVFG